MKVHNRSHRLLTVLTAAVGILAVGVSIPAASGQAEQATILEIDGPTRRVLDGGLKYLAQQQNLDGSWSVKQGKGGHAIAMTGYSLMAFMATGNLPEEGPYAKNVTAGMKFLLNSIQPDGYFSVDDGQYMYNHGIGTIALAELYGETQHPSLRPKLARLIEIIVDAQNKEGGWRYTPRPRDADISVTVMQVVALRAALNSGLSVPPEVIDRAVEYVRSCYFEKKGAFGYQPGKKPGMSRTAAAIYALQVCGEYEDPKVAAGSQFVLDNMKDKGWWTYAAFYAAPAQFMVGGDIWKEWYEGMRTVLLSRVVQEGDVAYWKPTFDKNDLSPIFTTAVYVHVLAMPMNFVPLYQR